MHLAWQARRRVYEVQVPMARIGDARRMSLGATRPILRKSPLFRGLIGSSHASAKGGPNRRLATAGSPLTQTVR